MPRILISLTALLALSATCPTASNAATNGPVVIASDSVFLQPLSGPEVTRTTSVGAAAISASRDGSLLAFSSGPFGGMTKLTFGATAGGPLTTHVLRGISIHTIDISPNGRLIALTAFRDSDSQAGHIFAYLVRRDGTKLRRLPTKAKLAADMRFAPDGKSLLYVSPSTTPTEISDCTASIRRIRLNGTHDVSLYKGTGGALACPQQISVSPDGRSVAMTGFTSGDEPAGPGPAPGIYRLSLTSRTAKPKLLVQGGRAAAWSPAGDQIAYSAVPVDPRDQTSGPTGIFRIPRNGGTPVRVSDRGFSNSIAWLPAMG